jgi:hypothetical protein
VPRSASSVVENSFLKGLVTEATGLNFPENAVADTYNCVFEVDGSLRRRLGIDFEDDFQTASLSTITNQTINSFVWDNVAGLGQTTFVVVQIGTMLHFYEVNEVGALSSTKKSFTVNLTSYQTSGAPTPALESCSFASGNGHLFVTHSYCEPFYIEYNADNDTISSNQINLQIRDFAGIDDDLDVDERPVMLTDEHEYNLRNQGWSDDVATDSAGSSEDSISFWANNRPDYPSNSDVWWYSKNADDEMDNTRLNAVQVGNTQAPRGHFILNPFYVDRAAISGIAGLPVETTSYFRPSQSAFFAGRAFYAGIKYRGFASKIYFSQIIEDDEQYGQCYQANDPTSETLFDLLPTDGGVIVIPELGEVIKMHSLQNTLIVFATNGVWAITGNEGIGFTANDYSIKRISNTASIRSFSFVDVMGLPVWWTADDIFTIQYDQQTGAVSLQSLTDQTIRSFFLDIPITSKYYAQGAYNPRSQQIQWIYRSTTATDFHENFQYDRILTLNVASGAFFPWSVGEVEDGPVISSIVAVQGTGTERDEEVVTNNALEVVVDSLADPVTVDVLTAVPLSSEFKYLTIYPNGALFNMTFSQVHNVLHLDWETFDGDGVEMDAYAIAGHKVAGGGLQRFQSNYLVIYSKVETESGFYIQGVWDQTNTGSGTGKWSVPQQGYKHDTRYNATSKKLKIRGSGRSLQIRISSEPQKSFNIQGWAVFVTSNQYP